MIRSNLSYIRPNLMAVSSQLAAVGPIKPAASHLLSIRHCRYCGDQRSGEQQHSHYSDLHLFSPPKEWV
jgi:hypothetical protein